MADCPFGCVKQIGNFILTTWVFPPVKRHFDYWWCFDENIQGLKEGIRDFDRETYDINQKIEKARLRTETIRPGVEGWSKAGMEKLAEARNILPDDNIPKAWNFFSRYSLGRSAKKTADHIAELRKNGNFNTISDPAPPASMGSISHIPTMDIESRKQIEEDIMESMKNNGIRMIVIYGMGGVGKTTMVERIRNRVEKSLFDEVVMVVVKQQPDMFKIQKEIADILGLKFDVDSMSARADKLRTRLMDKNRKLIIFDDVWEIPKLEDMGVPFESGFERCKILFTCRFSGIWEVFKGKRVYELKVLNEEEAWILFKDKSGECVEDSALVSVAKDVVAECKGLPIALVTVGTALTNERDIRIWEDSLSQLRLSNPTDFPEVETKVYKPLKLSYDFLNSPRERYLFLLCCLFPEDYNIPVEELTWYSMGLRMFDMFRNIEEARNRMHKLVKILKSRFLLMDGQDKDHVRMHDVVRDVGIFIGSKEKDIFLKSFEVISVDSLSENSSPDCKWMSANILDERIDLPLGSHFPNLRLLRMKKLSYDEISDISFEGMKGLNVLYFSSFAFGLLPPTVGLLKNLRTLCLYNCVLGNISVIGELASLEILAFSECYGIEELPAEIGRLNRLRLLQLHHCTCIKTIAFGIISSLVRLEELKMRRSFSRWEAEGNGKERRNASLTELKSLPNLTSLEIEISDWNLAAQEMCLSQKLVKFCIHIACKVYYDERKDREKTVNLNLPRQITVGKWISLLVRNTKFLGLRGYGLNNFNLAESLDLRNLEISNCSMENSMNCNFGTIPLLESLSLCRLEKLEEIWDGTTSKGSSNSFHNLKEIYFLELPDLLHLWKTPNQNVSLPNLTSIQVMYCSNLRYLFSLVTATSLLQLEVLHIESCETLEQVFFNEITDTDDSIEFPNLKTLTLKYLPNLTAVSQGIESINFPKLTQVAIGYLPKFNSLSPLNSELLCNDSSLCNQEIENASGDRSLNSICHQQIPITMFRNLEKLNVFNFNDISYLMPYSIAKNLVFLKYLDINDCQDMVAVIAGDDDDEKQAVDTVSLFPTLEVLKINALLKLTSFCYWKHAFELPSLEDVEIDDCPEMETFSLGSISTPKVKRFTINKQEMDDTKDFNAAIHQYFRTRVKVFTN